MHIIPTILAIILTLALAFVPAAAQADAAYIDADDLPHPFSGAPAVEGMPADIRCASAVLCEPDSGRIILMQNADEPRPIASVTKIMAILLGIEAVEQGRASLDDMVTVSANASGMGGSQVFLDVNETIAYGDLLRGMIVASANDATVAVGEFLYGSADLFVQQMNERAAELGMTATRFVNCTGLPADGHVSTARDVAIMTRELVQHPLYFDDSTLWMEDLVHSDGRVTQLTNTNRLTRLYDGCDGGKTGFTNAAGYCLSATAQRGDMRLIAVVLGAETSTERFDSAAALMDYGFANFRRYPAALAGTPVKGEIHVSGGDPASIPLLLGADLTLLLPRGGEDSVTFSAELPETLHAPVAQGDICGAVEVRVDGQPVATLPLLAGADSDACGLMPALRRIFSRWTADTAG